MNKERRKALDAAIAILEEIRGKLEDAANIVREAGEEEQECFDNLTEGLQAAERGHRMEEVATSLEDIAGEIEALDVDDLITRINECQE